MVLKECSEKHGRQFAKVTPQYERIRFEQRRDTRFSKDRGRAEGKVGQIKVQGQPCFSDRKLSGR